ncbi:PREDICTED: protein ENDOSPERM DEFECTIVE 1-like isoform X2 [Nelumbo nucifera]|uniref:Protein ENDOSPERM DEFECTIVE 1-like isoform X2 n=1 Tax=Nelumbo nucifera TaxID=4432 RepID=A0A1U7ZFL7_NELNU|nr:PREDICTED: protein ENDOSPERM DEFECTIVE 1-like isoform X2 [Nelumbo nucifera]
MSEVMAEACTSTHERQQQQITTSTASTATGGAPPPHRRPRVREVSSRFMSPVGSSLSSGDFHLLASKCPTPKQNQQQRSQSVQRRHVGPDPLSTADENRFDIHLSSETPQCLQRKAALPVQQRKQRAVKLFKENECSREQQLQDPEAIHLKTLSSGKFPTRICSVSHSRPDTPTVHSLYRATTTARPVHRSTNIASIATTAAAKLVQSSGLAAASVHEISSRVDDCDLAHSDTETENSTISDCSETKPCSSYSQGSMCSSPPIPPQNSKIRCLPDVRLSMPEADLLPAMSSRLVAGRNFKQRDGDVVGDSCISSASPCYRSLNTPLSGCCENSLLSPSKSLYKSSHFLSKQSIPSMKTSGVCLPPHPANMKLGAEARKGRKVSSQQENVHTFRLLHNRYLQWRYANAKAEAAMNAQKIAAEGSLYALGIKISELQDSVTRKRVELERLKKTRILSNVLEYQEWFAMERHYSSSLSGVVKALEDASVRIPFNGNVKADIREVGEAMNSALNVMEIISSNLGNFCPKAEQLDNLISELARVASSEKTLVEECGDLSSKIQMLQIVECSLRGQLIQMNHSSFDQPKEQ